LGAALSPLSAISKSYKWACFTVPIEGLSSRTLWLIFNPNRYRSKAAEAFSREILPKFATTGWSKETLESPQVQTDALKAAAHNSTGS